MSYQRVPKGQLKALIYIDVSSYPTDPRLIASSLLMNVYTHRLPEVVKIFVLAMVGELDAA